MRRRRDGESGVTSMEVALALILFIPLMMATVDLTFYFVALHNLTALVSGAARAAQGDPTLQYCDGTASSWSGVHTYAPLLDPEQLTLCITQPFIALGVQTLTVTATYNFSSITFLNQLTGPITETVTYNF